MRCLAPPGHELRWLVPTCVALIAPLADIFTAVNNDAAAITGFTFFLWGGVHALTRRMTWLHVLWLIAAMTFTVMAKQALIFSVALLPLVLLMGLWRNRQWPWYWVWLIAAAGMAGVALLVLASRERCLLDNPLVGARPQPRGTSPSHPWGTMQWLP